MDKTLILAPLQGYTDLAFRNVYASHFGGVDEALAPFISTMGHHRIRPARIADVLPEKNRIPVTPQILGNHPEDFVVLASALRDAGHGTVNWNLGCPHSKVAKKRRGSGLLPHVDEIRRFLDHVMQRIPCRLSLKVRLGRRMPTEIFDLLPVFDDYPIQEIIVHPRTGIQMYEGVADPDAFGQVGMKTRHRLVYNGDITGVGIFRKLSERFPGVDRFMIGRGILANPFLPDVIKGGHDGCHYDTEVLKAFHQDLFEAYAERLRGPGHLIGRMKGFWAYLGPSFAGSRKALKTVLKAKTKEAYLSAVDRFFDTCQEFSPLI